jgi:hypothetical protein
MSAITVANTDWSIVEAVKTALADATIGGAAVFEAVTVTTSDAQAGQCQFHSSPIAIVHYVTTREDDSPEDTRACCVALRLTLAALVDSAGVDESARLQEALRLKNAAVNAVETDPPADSHAWGDGDHYHRQIEWGRAEVDASADQPWVVCRLPVEIGFVLDSPTSH